MKKLLLTFCSLAILMTQAEGKELKIQVQVTPSASKNFAINELQFQWENNDAPEQLPPLTWNAQNKCFEGTINPNSEYYREHLYKISTPDNRIYFRGMIQGDVLWDENITSVEEHADFSPYHFVEITSASENYSVEVDYLGSPRTGDNIIDASFLGVHCNLSGNATYLKSGDYECDVNSKDKQGIIIATEPQFFTVDGQDVSYRFDTGLESMHLATIFVKDAMGQPAVNAEISWATLSENQSPTTDENGKAQIYLKNGEYFYAPIIDSEYYISSSYNIGDKLTIAGKDVTAEYSYKEKGWTKQDFIVKGTDISYADLTINIPDDNVSYNFHIDMENGQGKTTLFTSKGRYQYSVTADNYSFDYIPVTNTVDIDKEQTTEINFNKAAYRNVNFSLKNIPEEYKYDIKMYQEDGMLAQKLSQSFSIGENESNLSTRANYQDDAATSLLPGKYCGVVHLTDERQYDKYNKILIQAPFEVNETGENDAVFDFASQQLGTVTYAITNVPEEISSCDIVAYISDQDGFILDTLYRSNEDWQTLEELKLPAGTYTMHWRNLHFGNNDYGYNAELVLVYDQEFELKANETYQATLDYKQLALTQITPTIAENAQIWGFAIKKDNSIYAADMGYDTSADKFYLAGDAGTYTIQLWGMKNDDFSMNLQSKETSFSNTTGQTNNLDVAVDQEAAGLACFINLRNHFGAPINDATVTINGKQHPVKGTNHVYQDLVTGDVLNISVEAPGYEKLTIQRPLSELIKVYGLIDLTLFLNPDNGTTNVSQTEQNELAIIRTKQNEFTIASTGQNSWNYRILDLQGMSITNGRTNSSKTTIALDLLKSGVYILELTQGTKQRVLKFVR